MTGDNIEVRREAPNSPIADNLVTIISDRCRNRKIQRNALSRTPTETMTRRQRKTRYCGNRTTAITRLYTKTKRYPVKRLHGIETPPRS